MNKNEVFVSNLYTLTADTAKNAQEVTLLDLNKTVRRVAEQSVVALVRDVDGKRMRFGWLVDGYNKQRFKLQTLIEWLKIYNYGNSVISERDYILFLDNDIVGQLKRAEFEDADIKHKARLLYNRYMLFSEMLDDEIRNLLVELEADDNIEHIEAGNLPDVPDEVIENCTYSEV